MALLGPFSVGYPVLFRSGGDTTRVAFGKHIQEIERIYGILNALDSDKISASDLDDKLAAFKPKLSFSDISGTLDISKITGNLDFSRITGNVPASRVVGKLSNANIDAGNVNGLNALVQSLIPAPEAGGNGDGITDVDADENGYALFANGLLIQWGKVAWQSDARQKVNFPKPFPNLCFHLTLSVSTDGWPRMDGSIFADARVVTVTPIDKLTTKSEFFFDWRSYWLNENGSQTNEYIKMRYIAIGY